MDNEWRKFYIWLAFNWGFSSLLHEWSNHSTDLHYIQKVWSTKMRLSNKCQEYSTCFSRENQLTYSTCEIWLCEAVCWNYRYEKAAFTYLREKFLILINQQNGYHLLVSLGHVSHKKVSEKKLEEIFVSLKLHFLDSCLDFSPANLCILTRWLSE